MLLLFSSQASHTRRSPFGSTDQNTGKRIINPSRIKISTSSTGVVRHAAHARVVCRPRRPAPRASETQPQASTASPPRKTTSFCPIVVPSQTVVNGIYPPPRKSGQGSGSVRPSWRKVDKRQGKHKDKDKDNMSDEIKFHDEEKDKTTLCNQIFR